jgi:FtsP/CotA-like multicopper oxidase with cupredoxin domain
MYQSLVNDNLKKDMLLLWSSVAIAIFAVLLLSNIGTTSFLVQTQAFELENQSQSTPFPGMNFAKPIDVWSKNGVLKTTLVVDSQAGTIDGRPFNAMLYNGSLPGPALHVYPGDRLELDLINNLNEPTNLHFHGFHVSPANNSDNIFLDVAPGKTQHYSVHIPKDHPLGTDWYHPHFHGLTYTQVNNGLTGLIIVEGLQKLLPKPLQNITTHNFAMKDFPFDPLFSETYNMSHVFTGHERLTVNGEVNPVVNIKSGETQLWRFANMNTETYEQFRGAGLKFHIIAEDGYPVSKVVVNDTLFFPFGKRFDVLVTGQGNGSIPLRVVNNTFNDHPYGTVYATVNVQGNQNVKPVSLPTTLPPFANSSSSYKWKDLSNATISAHRVLTFQSDDRDWIYTINNETFAPNRIDEKVKLGTVEEWKLINLDPVTSFNYHPFHIHTNHVQVMSVNGKPYDANGRQDIVNIPTGGNVVIRIPAYDFVGKTVYHCHLLFHEDFGMMGNVEWVK